MAIYILRRGSSGLARCGGPGGWWPALAFTGQLMLADAAQKLYDTKEQRWHHLTAVHVCLPWFVGFYCATCAPSVIRYAPFWEVAIACAMLPMYAGLAVLCHRYMGARLNTLSRAGSLAKDECVGAEGRLCFGLLR